MDERLMAGLGDFGMMAKRTAEVREDATGDCPFGNANFVMFGDNGQLPPTSDEPLFSKNVGSNSNKMAGKRAYERFENAITLTQQMRRAEDPEHMAALNRLHDAATTKADWELFKSRSCHAGNPAFGATVRVQQISCAMRFTCTPPTPSLTRKFHGEKARKSHCQVPGYFYRQGQIDS
jgi:hypothetical protein